MNINYHLDVANYVGDYDSMTEEERKVTFESIAIEVPYDYYHSHARMEMLFSMDMSSIVKLKWVAAIFFVLAHFAASWMILRWLHGTGVHMRWLMYIYGGATLVVILAYGLASVMESPSTYQVSRKALSFVQSLIPLMIMYPVVLLQRRTQHEEL